MIKEGLQINNDEKKKKIELLKDYYELAAKHQLVGDNAESTKTCQEGLLLFPDDPYLQRLLVAAQRKSTI